MSSFYLVRQPSGYVYGLVITEVKQGWTVQVLGWVTAQGVCSSDLLLSVSILDLILLAGTLGRVL